MIPGSQYFNIKLRFTHLKKYDTLHFTICFVSLNQESYHIISTKNDLLCDVVEILKENKNMQSMQVVTIKFDSKRNRKDKQKKQINNRVPQHCFLWCSYAGQTAVILGIGLGCDTCN